MQHKLPWHCSFSRPFLALCSINRSWFGGTFVSYLVIIGFISASLVSPPSEGFPGEIPVGIQISQSQAEFAAHPTQGEPCLTSLMLPSPASKGEHLGFQELKIRL